MEDATLNMRTSYYYLTAAQLQFKKAVKDFGIHVGGDNMFRRAAAVFAVILCITISGCTAMRHLDGSLDEEMKKLEQYNEDARRTIREQKRDINQLTEQVANLNKEIEGLKPEVEPSQGATKNEITKAIEEDKSLIDQVSPVKENTITVGKMDAPPVTAVDEGIGPQAPTAKVLSGNGMTVKKIAFNRYKAGRERITLFCNQSCVPELFSLEDEKLRVVMDMKEVSLIQTKARNVKTKGKLVKRVRNYLDKQTNILRVVLDMEPSKYYVVRPMQYPSGNTYVLTIDEVKSKRKPGGSKDAKVPLTSREKRITILRPDLRSEKREDKRTPSSAGSTASEKKSVREALPKKLGAKSLATDKKKNVTFKVAGGGNEKRKLKAEERRMETKKALEEKRQKTATQAGHPVVEEQEKAKKGSAIAMANRPSQPLAQETARDGRFIAYMDETVLDTSTNLMWAAKDNGRDINWANAKSYCENYRGGGYTDWRLPTLDELSGLYDKTKTYRSTCGDVNLTKLIRLTCRAPWASEARGSEAAYFFFYSGDRRWDLQSSGQGARSLPVRSGK